MAPTQSLAPILFSRQFDCVEDRPSCQSPEALAVTGHLARIQSPFRPHLDSIQPPFSPHSALILFPLQTESSRENYEMNILRNV